MFDNLFDTLKPIMFGVTTGFMGYTATWVPTSNALEAAAFNDDFLTDQPQTAKVHYKDATAAFDLTGQKFDLARWTMEYLTNDFKQLKLAVDRSSQTETVVIIINGLPTEFYVREVSTKYDGGTSVANLDPVNYDDGIQ